MSTTKVRTPGWYADDDVGAMRYWDGQQWADPIPPESAPQQPTGSWAAGWYPDPMHHAALREWTGGQWSRWISDGTSVWADPLAVRRPLAAGDLDHLLFVADVFLPDALHKGVVTPPAVGRLRQLVHDLTVEASESTPSVAPSAVAAAPPRTTAQSHQSLSTFTPPGAAVHATRPVTSPAVAPATVPQAARPASALTLWWRRTRDAVGSDLAVHGLAYLGVLLFFVGVFGLLAFAFADVTRGLRPVAELLIAIAPFGAAALLLHRGALIVGRALEVAGGLLLPLVMLTTVLDGVAFPPDVTEQALVITLTTMCAALCVGYALWCRLHPDSALRFLVAPMAWLTVAMATVGVGREIPSGKDVAVPISGQVAAVAAAFVMTVALCRMRPRWQLATPTVTVAVPSWLIVATLAVLTWAADGWPVVPVLVTGALLVAAVELLAVRLPGAVVGLVEPLWWSAVCVALAPGLGLPRAAAIGVVGFVLLIEGAAAARRPVWAVVVPAGGACAALAVVWVSPWWAFGVLAGVSLWAMVRRLVPFAVDGAAVGLDLAAVALPLWTLIALASATEVPVAAAAGAGLVLLATVPATRPVLRRDGDDHFWSVWWFVVTVAVGCGAVVGWTLAPSAGQQWLVAGSLAALAVACAVGPVAPVWRPWPALILGGSAWVLVCHLATFPDVVRGVVLGVVALGLVGVAHSSHLIPRASVGASMGLAGHALAFVSLGAAGADWGLVAVTALATAGWGVTAGLDLRDRSPVGTALASLGQPARYLPCALVAVGVPATAALALETSGALSLRSVWAPSVLAVTALCYAVIARLRVPQRLGATTAWGAFVAGLGASALAVEPAPAAVGLGALVCCVVLLPASRRAVPMTWVAWAAVAPLVGLVAVEVWPWFAALPEATAAATTLVAVGGAMVLAAAAVEVRHGGWVTRWIPEIPAVRPPLILGGLEVGAALYLALRLVAEPANGWVSVSIAALCVAVGLLARVGLLSGIAGMLGWVAVLQLASAQIGDEPWIAVLALTTLLAVAEVLHRVSSDRCWWSRWDVPPLVVAVPVAVTALVAAADGDWFVVTFVVVGFESLAVAARLWHVAPFAAVLAPAGTLLILAGAARAGSGWLSLSLLALAAVLTVAANRTHEAQRVLCQAGAVLAALAAWTVGLTWLAWSAQQSVDASAMVAGAIAVAGACVAWTRRVDRSWILAVSGTSVVVTAAATFAAERSALARGTDAYGSVSPSAWVAGGLFLATLALLLSAQPLRLGWLRDLGAAGALASAAVTLQVLDVGPAVQVSVWVVTSTTCAILVLAMGTRPVAGSWRRPTLLLGLATLLAGLWVATLQLPDRSLLVPALAVASVQAAVIGIALRSVVIEALSPLLACAAWLVFASEASDGNPQWFTIPIGLALLVVVALWRHDRAVHNAPLGPPEVVALELVAIAFLVGSSFVQALTENVGYALIALAIGGSIAAWGLVTKVRRRVAVGAIVVLVSLTVLVAVPLVHLLPQWGGAGLWIVIAAVGLAAVLVATMLEQGRIAVRRSMERIHDAMAGWE